MLTKTPLALFFGLILTATSTWAVDMEFKLPSDSSGALTVDKADGSEAFRVQPDGAVAIGTAAPDASALLQLSSTTKGILPPTMTTVQRDAIASPADGLTLYNSDDECLNSYDATKGNWVNYCLAGKLIVDAYIGGAELTEANSASIKAVEYNTVVTNLYDSWDTQDFFFTAPFDGYYRVNAGFAQSKCDSTYGVRIGISKPNEGRPGGNASLAKFLIQRGGLIGCNMPGIFDISDISYLNQGDEIFIQARYQNSGYDVSSASYDNSALNSLKIVYVGQ